MKVKKIVDFLEARYDKGLAYEGDPIGLYVLDENREIDKVMVALDLTLEVFEEAVTNNVDLLVVHHPFTYNGEDPEVIAFNQHKMDLCQKQQLGVYVMHTNYDVADNGMNDVLISKLGLSDIRKSKLDNTSYQFMRHGKTQTTLYELADRLKSIFDLKFVRIIGEDKPVKKIGILGGDGSEFMVQIEALKEGVDAYITGDFRYTRGLYAKENNLAVIELPHSIENVFIDHVYNQLNDLDVEVIKTQINTDPFKYY